MSATFRYRISLEQRRPNNTVLSAEQFFGLNKKRLRLLGRWLSLRRFNTVTFMLYVRDPEHWVASKALEQLKTGHLGFNRGFFSPLAKLHTFASAVEEIFGTPVSLRRYDKNCLHGRDVRKDFIAHLFPQIDLNQLTYPDVTPNESISPEAGIILAEVRERNFSELPKKVVPQQLRDIMYASINFERRIGRPKPRLQEDVVERVLSANAEALSWLHSDYGLVFRQTLASHEVV